MDQFDDLPDVVEKDDKPKFVTEVHKPPGQLQQVSTWPVSMFGDNMTESEPVQGQQVDRRRRFLAGVTSVRLEAAFDCVPFSSRLIAGGRPPVLKAMPNDLGSDKESITVEFDAELAYHGSRLKPQCEAEDASDGATVVEDPDSTTDITAGIPEPPVPTEGGLKRLDVTVGCAKCPTTPPDWSWTSTARAGAPRRRARARGGTGP